MYVRLPWLVVLATATACNRREATTPPPPTTTTATTIAIDATTDTTDANDANAGPCPVANASLGPGLVVERWHVANATPIVGDPCIDVVRADPTLYELRALTKGRQSATAWLAQHRLVAVTNAGMFHDSGAPVGLVIADGTVHGIDNKKFGGYLAWHPRDPGSPSVAMLCAASDRDAYRSVVQSYRLLDCNGDAIRWQDPKHYSAVAIGLDRNNHIVFLHVRAAFTMAELSAALADHDLRGALFLEGGPEASLVVHGPTGTLERVGSYETGFNENDDNAAFWDLPNVIGLVDRADQHTRPM